MWDDGVATDATTPSPPIAIDRVGQGQARTCATCEQPAPPGKLRCDLCVRLEWETLKAADPAWYERHRMDRRQTAGGNT